MTNELFSYIDPFIGSLFLQLLSMMFVAALIFFKKVRIFFKNLLAGIFGTKISTDETTASSDVAEITENSSDPETPPTS